MQKSDKKICVIGLGYIGLPTASMFATNGYCVHGVDINAQVIDTLKRGGLHIEEPGLATVVNAALASKNLTVDTRPSPSDVFIIAVPTPYSHAEGTIPTADMSYVKSALDSILPFVQKGNLVILESTSPPGTTRDLIMPALEKKGLKPGSDVGVAYCPERVIPGRALKELIENDRVVGAIDQTWGEYTLKLYKSFVAGKIFITDPTTAEMIKIVENTYRDVNIALANEVAILCEKLGISAWNVIEMANRHPRVHVHNPGPGVGGHCISVDPWFLVEKFSKEAQLIHLARIVNDRMPMRVVEIIEKLLDGKKKAKIVIMGLAYKANVDDARESPALTVVDLLQKRNPSFTLGLFDPHVNLKKYPTQSEEEAFQAADLAVLLTAHDEFKALDPNQVGSRMKSRIVLDTHNVLRAEKWMPAGFEMHVLGTSSVLAGKKALSS